MVLFLYRGEASKVISPQRGGKIKKEKKKEKEKNT